MFVWQPPVTLRCFLCVSNFITVMALVIETVCQEAKLLNDNKSCSPFWTVKMIGEEKVILFHCYSVVLLHQWLEIWMISVVTSNNFVTEFKKVNNLKLFSKAKSSFTLPCDVQASVHILNCTQTHTQIKLSCHAQHCVIAFVCLFFYKVLLFLFWEKLCYRL